MLNSLNSGALQRLAVQAPAWLAALGTQPVVSSFLQAVTPVATSERCGRAMSSTAACSTSNRGVGTQHEFKPLLKHAAGRKAHSLRNFSRRAHCKEETDVSFNDMLQQPASLTPDGAPKAGASTASEVSSVSQVIFDSCWRRFEERYLLKNIFVPREVVYLNGAPGSGKGANTQHILQTRGLEHSFSLSDLMKEHPDSRELINRGDMVPDTTVGDLLLEALLTTCKAPECGILVDGFPRTALQVDFLKLLNDKLTELHSVWANTQHEAQFPRPLFKVVMLYVAEEMSIARQMARAEMASRHNKRVMDAGAGALVEQRATDISIEKCKKRYAIFKQHYAASLRLKQFFPFHLIDAMGSLAETQEAILTELRYQSSLDLGQETYQAIRHLTVAKDLVQHARQQLVSRLDDHCSKYPHLFQRVIDIITAEIMPVLRESGMSGQVEFVSDLRVFNDHPRTAQMLIDILTDRGFKASHSAEVAHVPVQVDLASGLIKNRKETKHRFLINWDSRSVRDWHALELDARAVEPAGKAGVSQSFIPTNPPPLRAATAPRTNGRVAMDAEAAGNGGRSGGNGGNGNGGNCGGEDLDLQIVNGS